MRARKGRLRLSPRTSWSRSGVIRLCSWRGCSSNNQIAKWEELDRLRDLPFLKDINLLNNPIVSVERALPSQLGSPATRCHPPFEQLG